MAEVKKPKLRKFDTKIQLLKYKVLREVARHAYDDTLLESFNDIAKVVVKDKPTMRCCIYKEMAVVGERVKIATGGDRSNPHIIEVIDIACDSCPEGGYEVTYDCRGCIAHRCEDACRRGAISFDEHQKAHIDKDKCVNCGMCAKVCPYSAIANRKRPCENACKIKAISKDPETRAAKIDYNKCISCGACVYQCPFGAISDKSYILNVVDYIKKGEQNPDLNVIAIVAPSIGSQFSYAKHGQVIAGIKKLGFKTIVEAALGADIVSYSESKELVEKGFLTSSCCPGFVSYIEKNMPKMADKISHNLSPMASIAKVLREKDKEAKIVFVGPCTAKKAEVLKDNVKPYIDAVITFEELQALFDSRDIDITELDEETLDTATYFGRIFARSGGLAEAIANALKERNVSEDDFKLNAVVCSGIEECRTELLKAFAGRSPYNFIEGMACVGGCIGGAGCLTHEAKDSRQIDSYGKESTVNTLMESLGQIDYPVDK